MKQIKSILVLVVICSVTALLLALTNSFTSPIIEEAEAQAALAALAEVLPGGEGFSEVDLSAHTLPATVKKAYKASNGGYVIELETSGYASGMKLMYGVTADGAIAGAKCLSSNETLGHEKTYGGNFVGKDADGVGSVDIISGATKTTGAMRSAAIDAINTATILGGGSVDIRTHEEKINDALPAGEGKFTEEFLPAAIDGLDAVYAADNGKGKVLVMGDKYIGVDADGKLVGEFDAETKANAEAALAKLAENTLTEVDLTQYKGLPVSVLSAKRTQSGISVIEIKASGYKDGMIILVGIDADGKVTSAKCTSSNETNGAEAAYGDKLIGKTKDDIDTVDTVAGSTLTTSAFRGAVKDALNAAVILGGGWVDTRTPEEILADNLAAALPAGEGKFSRMFIVEVLDGVSAVYSADNGAGMVLAMGESYIGVGADGVAVGDLDAELKAKAEAEAAKLLSSTAEDIDASKYTDLDKKFISAFKTASGNYIIETKGAGYGIIGDDHGGYVQLSGEYIHIRVCISADGKIIDIITTKHAETATIGGANVCDNPEYYGQYLSKTEENYAEVDGIAGATNSSDGYRQAVKVAFESYKILKGGN